MLSAELKEGERGALALIARQPGGAGVASALGEPGLLIRVGPGTPLDQAIGAAISRRQLPAGGLLHGRGLRLWRSNRINTCRMWKMGSSDEEVWHERLLEEALGGALPLLLLGSEARVQQQDEPPIRRLLQVLRQTGEDWLNRAKLDDHEGPEGIDSWLRRLPATEAFSGVQVKREPLQRIDVMLAAWGWVDQSAPLHGGRACIASELTQDAFASAWRESALEERGRVAEALPAGAAARLATQLLGSLASTVDQGFEPQLASALESTPAGTREWCHGGAILRAAWAPAAPEGNDTIGGMAGPRGLPWRLAWIGGAHQGGSDFDQVLVRLCPA